MLASANPVVDWKIRGSVTPTKDGTRFFYDDGTTRNDPDGSFELIKRSVAKAGKAAPPKWMCVYNPSAGFKVVSLNRDVQHPDIAAYNVSFNDDTHEILVRKAIDIASLEKDSVVAVANFIEANPELKSKVLQIDPTFLQKADVIKKQRTIDKARLARFNASQIKPINR